MEKIITDLTLLETPSEPVKFIKENGTIDTSECLDIIAQLKTYLKDNSDAISIAAPQIGINKRIFCIRFNDIIKTFINPIITKKLNNTICIETFNSMPGKEILISRPKEISAVYYTEEFKYEDNKLLDTAAAIFDQQAQLLDGVLPTELGLVSDIEEDGSLYDLTESEFSEFLKIYKKYIELKIEANNKIFENNSELASQYRKLKFSEDVINGRAEIIANSPPNLNREQRRNIKQNLKKVDKHK